jgi:serine/arginine repetitive matrix protein 2
MQNPNIPTAPKAIRGPPVAPRASLDRGQPLHRPMDRNGLAPARVLPGAPRAPAWNQWIRPGAPQYREPTVPAKRDSNGEEKAQQFMPRTSPQNMNRQVSDPTSMRAEEVKDDRAFKTAPVSPERRSSDVNAVNNAPFQREYSVPSPVEKVDSDLAVDVDVATAESSEESISDEEGMDLDEEDFAQSKAKFERQRAHLEAQMIDLNARQYRATTPLAQISRLANITVHDLLPAQDSIPTEVKDDVMEGLETSEAPARAASPLHPPSPTIQEDVPTDLIIPKREQTEEAETVAIPPVQMMYKQPEPDRVLESAEIDQGEDIDMEGSEDLDFITPEPKRSIETITLPYLAKAPLTPLSDLGAFHENMARLNAAKPALIMHYQAQAEEEQIVQKDLQEQYVEKYRAWKLETQLLDRERASKETEERQMSVELGLDIESSPIMENPISESSRSRLHKFSSEYDIQQVLKQSEETARLEQEKVERESRRAQIDLEKEAIPPDMWDEASKEKRIFKNMNRYRDPICLTDIYGYEPEFDTFTETEHKRFVELFKERPKQWGEIAAQLPGRSYADCIHHYYKYKWDGRFKEKQKRKAKGGGRRGGKTGRAKPATLMSDLRKDGEEDSSSGPMLTETGRPRRAATRTAYTAEKDPEVKPVAAAATANKKVPAPGEVVPEKPAKRRKTTAAGDKPQKRGRQTLVSTVTSVTSPAGTDKEVVLSQEDFARAKQLEEAALLTGIYTGTRALGGPQHVEYAHDPLPVQVPNDTAERIRAPAQTSMQRSSASSYWSVPEQTDFVKFIAHFGTDFGAIANHMGTKTQTMVCNHLFAHNSSIANLIIGQELLPKTCREYKSPGCC